MSKTLRSRQRLSAAVVGAMGLVLGLTSSVAQAEAEPASADVFVTQVRSTVSGPIDVTVGNDGPDTATGVLLTLRLQGDLGSSLSGADASSCVDDGNGLGWTCTFGDLALGDVRNVVLSADLLCGFVQSNAGVTASTPDPDAGDNTSQVEVRVSCTEAEPCVAIGFPCGDPCYDQTGEYRCSECVQAPPVFDAGPDQSVDEGDTVSLAGALIEVTLCDPAAVTPTWRQIVGPPVTLSDASSPTPTFTAPPVGSEQTLTFAFGVSGSEDTIDVVVLNVNNPPAALADAYDVVEDTTLNVPAAGVLGNDSDPDGDPLTAVLESGASHGSVQVNTDGSFSYTPSAEYSGADTFTYRAEDPSGERSEPVSVELTVRPVDDPPTAAVAGGACTTGTDAVVDLVIGDVDSDLADVTVRMSVSDPRLVPGAIAGGDGTDRTLSLTVVPEKALRTATVVVTADDGTSTASLVLRVLVGTSGKDTIAGTAGPDAIFGVNGMDTIAAGAGDDLVCSGNGKGTITGGDGDDTIDGQNGDDILRGGAGNDTILGGAGGDRLEGEAGNDAMTGGSGGDAFSGGDGTDTITDLTPGQGDIDDGTSP